jgi:hypothetical protein
MDKRNAGRKGKISPASFAKDEERKSQGRWNTASRERKMGLQSAQFKECSIH